MTLRQLLTSPPPATAWVLDHRLAAVLCRGRKDELVAAAAQLPGGVLEPGPVGLQGVDGDRLAPVLAELRARVGGARRVAVVLPTGWLRSHLLEFDHLPRRASELGDVVRWRLKKLLPINPVELRLSALPMAGAGDRRPVLTLAGLERAIAGLERAFAAAGMEPGFIGPAVLASGLGGDSPGPRLHVQHEERSLALILVVDGRPRLLRTKQLAGPEALLADLEREMSLVLRFVRERLEVAGEIAVEVVAVAGEVAAALEGWWRRQPGVRLERGLTMPAVSVSGVAGIGGARLEPAWRLLRGGLR